MESGSLIAGRYRLLERLGQGGMSVVWRADDEVLGREVAVKVLSAAYAADPAVSGQIRAEARSAAGLRHANVVSVFDYGEVTDGGRPLAFIVMELVDGRSLADMLTGGPLPWTLSVLVGAQVAAALAAAHAHGIVHRDVKPANVMVTAGGMKLVDFGISAAVGGLEDRAGQLLGTPAYLAPERIEGGPVRPATDVYALGLLLYRCLSGRMPWPAETVTQMVKAHVLQKPAPLPAVAGLPSPVTRLVSRCLAKRPADRPSAVEVADLLGEIAGLPSPALLRTTVESTVPIPAPVPRWRRRGVLVGGAVAFVALAAGAWGLQPESAGRPAAAGSRPPCAGATVADAGAPCPSAAGPSAGARPAPGPSSSPPPGAVLAVRTVPRRASAARAGDHRTAVAPPAAGGTKATDEKKAADVKGSDDKKAKPAAAKKPKKHKPGK